MAPLAPLFRDEGGQRLIRTTLSQEPPRFASEVRARGEAYLRITPKPTADQFKKRAYWKVALPWLKTAYGNICAFSSLWIPGQCSVDHFQPKAVRPDLAYEWSNYRLATDRINSNKGDSTRVLDPFQIQNGWFVLDLANLYVGPGAGLDAPTRAQVEETIKILRLNDDVWVEIRFEVLRDFLNGTVALDFLQRRYPFIAAEVTRQTTV